MAIRRNGRQRRREVSQMFHIPQGLEDIVYATEDESDLWYDPEDEPPDDDEDGPTKKKKRKKKKRKKKKKKGDKRKNPNKKKNKEKDRVGNNRKDVRTPKTFEILRQKIRTKPDGSQVVDLTVEVDRIIRANKYEFRITKKDTGKTTTQFEPGNP